MSSPMTKVGTYTYVLRMLKQKCQKNTMLVERKVCCYVANAFMGSFGVNLADVQALNVQKCVFSKKL